jgi:hypothetical protein
MFRCSDETGFTDRVLIESWKEAGTSLIIELTIPLEYVSFLRGHENSLGVYEKYSFKMTCMDVLSLALTVESGDIGHKAWWKCGRNSKRECENEMVGA